MFVYQIGLDVDSIQIYMLESAILQSRAEAEEEETISSNKKKKLDLIYFFSCKSIFLELSPC